MKGKKNILIITPYFYPAWSYWWIPRVMFDLAKQFTLDWYNVECATTDVFDNETRYTKKYEEIEWIKIYYFKNISNKLVVNLKFPIPIGYKKWINENITRFDIVHIADFRNLCSYYAYKYCKKYNINYIVSPFGTVPYTNDYKSIIKKVFDLIWSKKMLLNAKYVTVQTNDEYEEVNDFWVIKDNIKIIPLMIEYNKFMQLPEKWLIRKKYNISEKSKVLLFVWRIHEYKSTDMMIEVFYEFRKKYIDSYLIIVWRDDWYEYNLKNICKKLWLVKNIIFAWAVYYPYNLNYYIESDIYFMAPSHFEQTSTASLEALACWTPVVVTKQADIPFLEDYNAWKVVNFNKKDILEWIVDLTENKKKKEDCINLIKENYDVKSIKNSFLDIYF